MLKKYTINLRLRRLLTLILVFVLTITLTACNKTYTRFPVGSLNVDDIYAQIGETKVTVGELWEELRYSTSSLLTTKIEQVIVKVYVDEIKEVMAGADSDKKTEYTKDLITYARKGIFNVSEEDDLKNLTSKEKNVLAQTYISNLFLNNHTYIEKSKKGNVIDSNDLLADDYTSVYEYFYENLAKKLFAKAKLEKEIKEHDEDLKDDEDPYFSRSKITSRFKSDYVDVGDLKAIMIRFMNNDEVNATLKAFGIKVYKNAWYFVPGEDKKTFLEYSKYYDDLEIKTGVITSDEYMQLSVAYNEGTIAQIYVEMYNFVYTYRESLPNLGTIATSETIDRREITKSILANYDAYRETNEDSDEDLILSDLIKLLDNNTTTKKYTNFTAEGLNDINTSLKSYVYTTLNVPYEEVDADKTYSCYTTSGRSYGNYYYLIFKLSVEEDPYIEKYQLENADDIYSEDEDGEEYIDEELYPDLVAEIIAKLKDDEITDTYITNALTEAKEDIKLQIYDTILEISYSVSNSDYSKTHKKAPDQNTLAKIVYEDTDYFFTIDEAYSQLEATTGSSTAVDLLSKKYMKQTDYYQNISKDDEKIYENNLKYTLAMFANDQYSSYGYPASMGKYNFMIMYYRSADVKTIIKDYYKVNAAMSHYIYDYDNTLLLQQFVSYTEKAVSNYMSLSAANLLVFVDMNEDGIADKDFEWTQEYEDEAKNLINLFLKYIEASTETHSSALSTLVDEYNSSSRFDNGLCTPTTVGDKLEYDPTSPECTWAKYRRLGLYVTVKNHDGISSASTQADIDEPLKERLFEIYNNDELFTKKIASSQYIDYEQKGLKTDSGYNLLIVTSASLASEFKYTLEDNENAQYYVNIPFMVNEKKIFIEDALSNGDSVSINQIKLYIYEYLSTNTTDLIPSEVTSALSTFFNPVISRYTSSATQRELLLRYLYSEISSEISFTDTLNNDRFGQVRIINQLVEDKFMDANDLANNFGGWWQNIFVGGAQ